MKKLLLVFSFSILLVAVTTFVIIKSNYEDEIEQDSLRVSIIQLIANPTDYHGKIVRVIGVGNLEFEGNAIYLGRDDWKLVPKNGLWIELEEQEINYVHVKEYNGKYVIVEGTFDMNNTGHFGLYSGAITKITRYDLWE